jgi:hypothetical protein
MNLIRRLFLFFLTSIILFPFYCRAQDFPSHFPKEYGDFTPSAESSDPAEITLDYAQEKGAFSPYLFMVTDSPSALEEGFVFAKDANFKVIAMNQFFDPEHASNLAEEKAQLLCKYNLEAMVFVPAQEFLSKEALEKRLQALMQKIDEVTRACPGLRIKTFFFGNEPDFPGGIFWKGSKEQFFQNYTVFADFIKSKNRKFIVGGPGFAFYSGDWPEDFVRYVSSHDAPLDFLSFHAYSFEVGKGYVAGIKRLRELLTQFPVTNCLFDKPKIANTEWDIRISSLESGVYSEEMDTAFRAAHNILALSAMADNGLWMSAEFGGPFRFIQEFAPFSDDSHTDFLWIKENKTVKPVYYAHKAFNALADTVQITQKGSNFETFGVIAGKSKDDDLLSIVISSYDPNAYLATYMNAYKAFPGTEPFPVSSNGLRVYKTYTITIKNLPWNAASDLMLQRYVVDDDRHFELEELTELKGNRELVITRAIATPQVQLIKIQLKK